MKRSAVAAIALVGASVMTGSAVQSGSATTAAPEIHTKRFVLQELASRQVGRSTFVGSDKAKSVRTREVIGFDTYTGRFDRSTQRVVIQVALALKGGIIVGRVSQLATADQFHGRILKGTGKYRHVDGTITGGDTAAGKTVVTLNYTL